MTRSLRAAAWCTALLCVAACTHDLDALRSPSGGTGGTGGSGATGGSGGTGGSSGSGGAGGGEGDPDAGPEDAGEPDAAPPADACVSSCDALPTVALEIGLSRCCRGDGNLECGVSPDDGKTCVSESIQGRDDTTCPKVVGPNDVALPGCCRPDGYCGQSLAALDLGCIRRDQFADRGLGADEPIMCRYECNGDLACRAVPGHVCVEANEDPDPAQGFCALECESDGDCEEGLVCAITNNDRVDRVDAYCQLPLDGLDVGEGCQQPQDCARRLCAGSTSSASGGVCAELCGDSTDCPAERPTCALGEILIPSKKNEDPNDPALPGEWFQAFGFCSE